MRPVIQQVFLIIVFFVVYISSMLLIPRSLFRKYLIYGLLLGGLPELLLDGVFNRLLHWFSWTNIGPSNVWGWNVTIPLTVTFWVMLFLYYLPLRTAYLVPYVALFSLISVGMSQVTKNLGLFAYKPWFIYLMPFVFLVWFSVVAWVFRLEEKVMEERPVR